MQEVQITVNGLDRSANVEPRELLVHFLRDRLRLTGTHVGCDTSQCGACAVNIDGKAAKSCTVLTVQANRSRVDTIESYAQGMRLDVVQKAFQAHHALQCGFCTPGMIIAVHEILRRTPDPTEENIRHGLHGNLCRCTGYQNIVEAVKTAAAELRSKGNRDDAQLDRS